MNTFLACGVDLVPDSGRNRQPVEVAEERCDVVCFHFPYYASGCTVLDLLEFGGMC